MLIPEPKLWTPIFFAILAVLTLVMARETKLGWAQLALGLCGIIFLSAAVVTGLNWFMFNLNARLKERNEARYSGHVLVANAVRGLSNLQLDVVRDLDYSGSITWLLDLKSENSLRAFVKTPHGDVEFQHLVDLLEASVKTAPFLFPVREMKNREAAGACTDALVSAGFASPAIGNRPAKLRIPLQSLALIYGVTLD